MRDSLPVLPEGPGRAGRSALGTNIWWVFSEDSHAHQTRLSGGTCGLTGQRIRSQASPELESLLMPPVCVQPGQSQGCTGQQEAAVSSGPHTQPTWR